MAAQPVVHKTHHSKGSGTWWENNTIGWIIGSILIIILVVVIVLAVKRKFFSSHLKRCICCWRSPKLPTQETHTAQPEDDVTVELQEVQQKQQQQGGLLENRSV